MEKKIRCLNVLGVAILAMVLAGLNHELIAQQSGEGSAEAAGEKDARRLVKWTTLEDAFLKTNRNRIILRRYIAQQEEQLKNTEGEEQKQEVRKKIGEVRKRLHRINTAMDVIYGVAEDPQYVYNPVQSTVYVRVGTVQETFEEVARMRDRLRRTVADQKNKLDNAQDEDTKAKLQKALDAVVGRYQTVAAALQTVFGISPDRDFSYNPDNATLYLKVTDDELAEIKQRLAEQRGQTESADDDTGSAK
ncbi:MAG: hypothetical protein K9N51_06715 [Candidatus Pacebacteria bacterium]|nr:hypothetical protein [Candidatus Paceibacterota bacterium]